MLRVDDPFDQKYIDSEFGQRCLAAGTHCTDCVREEDRAIWGVSDAPSSSAHPGLAANKFMRAHEIYKELGLASPAELIGVSILKELSAKAPAKTRDALWYEAHGSTSGNPVCIRPCMWQAGQDVLEIAAIESLLVRNELGISAEMQSSLRARVSELDGSAAPADQDFHKRD
ncbi:MAG: hypothetical protein OXP73_08525 [Chloroflexota bacterium]|nr:hypothetical protein [Chloroflexota bacterium]